MNSQREFTLGDARRSRRPAAEVGMVLTAWDVRVGNFVCRIREVDEFGLAAAIYRTLEARIRGDFDIRLDLNPVTLKANGAGYITRRDGEILATLVLRVCNDRLCAPASGATPVDQSCRMNAPVPSRSPSER